MKNLFTLALLTIAGTTLAQPFSIGSRSVTLVDPSRNDRSIDCEMYYPATSAGTNAPVANGSFPVVVVGHGFSMGVGAYENWWTEFVPEGYIFILPNTEVGPIPFPSHPDFGLDLAFAASELQSWNTDNSSDFFEKVSDRTALMGHSMGGGCSFLAAENNPAITCILGLAPAETNTSAIAAAANVTAPSLILWGTEDEVTPEADHALAIHNGLASSCKQYVRIDQGAHCFFANYNFFCATGEMNIGTLSREDQQQVSYLLARPFFEFFLKDECEEWETLQTELTTNPELGTNLLSCPNDAPVIADNGGTLESTSAGNYQWYLNGSPIAGADQQTFNYSVSGEYQVGTVNIGNCEVLSNTINVAITGVEESSLNLLQHDAHSVRIHSKVALGNAKASWFDLTGRVIGTQSLQQVGQDGHYTITKPVHRGLKLLRITSEETSRTWRLF